MAKPKYGPGQSVEVNTLPDCDICKAKGYQPVRKARYDFRTRDGRWANGCREHWPAHRMYPTLGAGMGQRLMLPGEQT